MFNFLVGIFDLCSFPLFVHYHIRKTLSTAVPRRLRMTSNTGSCQKNRYGVVVCDNQEKWGGVVGIGERFIDAFGSNSDLEEWHLFAAIEGKIPSEEDLDTFDGFFISGSPHSANDNVKWITDLKRFIFSAAKKSTKARVVGVCFGHQLIGAALGGQVTMNPSKRFVLQSERIKTNEQFQGTQSLGELVRHINGGLLQLLECHGECVSTLPPGAQSLANSKTCQHEMIQFATNIVGIQAHPEFKQEDYEKMLIPELFSKGRISEEEKGFCLESIRKPLDSKEIAAALKQFVSTKSTGS